MQNRWLSTLLLILLYTLQLSGNVGSAADLAGARRLVGADRPREASTLLTEIVVVVCRATNTGCVNYVNLTPGVLTGGDCERIIQQIGQRNMTPAMVLHRERSFCKLVPMFTPTDSIT